ncbi:N-acylneuraminate-9-phosphatase [Chlorella sorokiniana]|uniref:N-acylneuraminate-9-phosphatase n=1 Tax=Chlorella sorokiniana TaxID=3076 RepID=A0A2P6TDY5_CHLSO|nr:N-acylneuraminate-9-phosphatase [Chlorella sorokiniana]|eukprot:PRW20863.1 N-acylneuraminate-9-phosphatase [Chlorella sorokiniana]
MRRLKAVFFDLDDTLVLTEDCDRAAFACVAQLAEELLPGCNGRRLVNEWRPLFHASPWCPEGKVEVEAWRAQLWLQAMGRQGHSDTDAAAALQRCFSSTRLQHFRFGEGVEPMVASLQQRGLQTVVITNGHATVQRQKLEACAAARLFRHILVGGEEIARGGHEKPHPSIFHKACSLAGCLPEEAVHVGDSLLADINGALRAGLAGAVWINRNGERPVPTGLRPAAILSSVLELPSALEQLQLLPQQEV